MTAPLYAEDLEMRHRFSTGGVTVTEAHIVTFAGFSGDMNQLHMDREWAENEGPHGARIAHGMAVLSLATGMRCMLDDLALIGFLGIEDWRFRRPVMIGDTVHCEMTLASLVPTSKPERSVLRVEVEVMNQYARTVQQGVWTMMILHKGASE